MMKLQVLCGGIVPKTQEFLPYRFFFQQSDENGVFPQFWSFEEKVISWFEFQNDWNK